MNVKLNIPTAVNVVTSFKSSGQTTSKFSFGLNFNVIKGSAGDAPEVNQRNPL